MKKILVVFLVVFSVFITNAQDIHFSQFTNAPLQLNPALTGFTECNMRIGLNYRNQWNSISTPYVTQSAYIDGKVTPKSFKRDWFGIGGLFYSDKAGEGALSNTKGMLLASYFKGLNRDNTFIIGIGAGIGIVNRSVDYNKLFFANQWDGTGFSNLLASNENYSDNSIFYADFNGGILVSYTKSSKFGYYGGISLSHINRPKDSFYNNGHRLGRKTIIHGGLLASLGENLMINPQLMYSTQKKSSETILGANFRFEYEVVNFYLGAWYRWARDIIPVAGLEYNGFVLMFSYDVISSDLNQGSNYRGGFEFSLSKRLMCTSKSSNRYNKRKFKKIECPTFM